MRRAELLGLVLVAVGWIGCEAIAGLGDFGPEPMATGGGGTTATGVGGSAAGGGQGGLGGAFEQPRASYSISFGSLGLDTIGGLDSPYNPSDTADDPSEIYFAGTHNAPIRIAQEHTNLEGEHVFLASLSEELLPRWSRSFPTAGESEVAGLTAGANGRARTAGTVNQAIHLGGGGGSESAGPDRDPFVVQHTPGGAHSSGVVWDMPQAQIAWAIAAASGGGVVGGQFHGTMDFTAEGKGSMTAVDTDGFVIRFGPAGEVTWILQIGDASGPTPGNQEVRALAIDPVTQRVFVAGIHDSEANIVSTPIPHGGSDTWDSFIAVLDETSPTSPPTVKDVETFTDDEPIVARGLAFRGNALAFAGSFEGSINLGGQSYSTEGGFDAFVAKLDVDDNGYIDQSGWSVVLGSTGEDVAYSTAIDSAGNVIAVGHFEETVDFGDAMRTADGMDAFVVKLDPSGSTRWSGAYGGSGRDTARRVCIDTQGAEPPLVDHIIVAGEFTDQIFFGNQLLESEGGQDIFIAKFLPNPTTLLPP